MCICSYEHTALLEYCVAMRQSKPPTMINVAELGADYINTALLETARFFVEEMQLHPISPHTRTHTLLTFTHSLP